MTFQARGKSADLIARINADTLWARRPWTGIALFVLGKLDPAIDLNVSVVLTDHEFLRKLLIWSDTPDETGRPTVFLRI